MKPGERTLAFHKVPYPSQGSPIRSEFAEIAQSCGAAFGKRAAPKPKKNREAGLEAGA